jgi:DnaJ-class molecular chaperone
MNEKCRVCGGSGVEFIPVYDDWGDVESHIDRPCDVCGGDGERDAEELAEMRACYGPEYMW